MSAKNFASYGDLETILTGFANAIKSKPGTLYADNPIGSIIPYGGATAPSGWFLCQGQAVSRTTYADLFAAIGTSFGTGDGSTTFNLPDLREATTKGVGLSGKSNNHFDEDGVALGEFVEDRIRAHNHTITSIFVPGSETTTYVAPIGQSSGNMVVTADAGSNTNEVKAVGVNYIIKAEHTPVPADFMDAVEEAVEEAAVDTIENGNMKPVTSNAVAKVINRTNELVWNTEYVDLGSWTSGGLLEKCGFIIINKIVTLKANCPSGALLCTGFPAPIVGMEIPISFDNEEMSGGLFLDVYGELRAWITPNENDENIRINLIYITND